MSQNTEVDPADLIDANGLRLYAPELPDGAKFDIQFGFFKKTTPFVEVNFDRVFDDIPIVILQPYWFHAGQEVKHVETLQGVARTHFRVGSDNSAGNYYVYWIAICPILGP